LDAVEAALKELPSAIVLLDLKNYVAVGVDELRVLRVSNEERGMLFEQIEHRVVLEETLDVIVLLPNDVLEPLAYLAHERLFDLLGLALN